jgi:cell wall-associated NlpC family hydrolase
MEIAAEKYNDARDKHSKLVSEKRVAAARLAKARRRLAKLENHLNTRANGMYRDGPLGFLDVLMGAKTFDQFARTWDVLKQLNADDAEFIAEMKVVRAEAKDAHKELVSKEKAAGKQLAVMRDNKSYVSSQLAERKRKLAGIEAEVAQLQAQEAAAALAAAQSSSSYSSGSDNFPTPSIPAHGDVVTYAKSRIGCPYSWGGSGPGRFDCSGLAMWCYKRVGISLPHSSAAQFGCGQRVSRKDLQPGDLVFFGSPVHHVGIYVGGGRMIHAPHTGARVRYASAFRSDYRGACRPR